MICIQKHAKSFAAVVATAGILTLAVPRTAHAVAAALVQVTNTSSNPVVAQTMPLMASQLVELYGNTLPSPSYYYQFNVITPNNENIPGYSIPQNQTLVITSADITPYNCPTSYIGVTNVGLFQNIENTGVTIYPRDSWTVSGQNTVHFSYPSGITLAGGISIGYNNNSQCSVAITLRGYLTSN